MGLDSDDREIVRAQNDSQDRTTRGESPVPHLRRSEKNRRQFPRELQLRFQEDRVSPRNHDTLVMAEWYRKALGISRTTSPDNETGTVRLAVRPSRRQGWRSLRAACHHPDLSVRLGTRLGMVGVCLGVVGIVARVARYGRAYRCPIRQRDLRYCLLHCVADPCYRGSARASAVEGCRMTERIALLGWGSLLWDKDEEFDDRHGRWRHRWTHAQTRVLPYFEKEPGGRLDAGDRHRERNGRA